MTRPAPTALPDLAAHKAQLEANRERLYPAWRRALEDHDGNITRAALAFVERHRDETDAAFRVRAKTYGMYLTRTFGLREWAGEMRREAGAEWGRPRKGA